MTAKAAVIAAAGSLIISAAKTAAAPNRTRTGRPPWASAPCVCIRRKRLRLSAGSAALLGIRQSSRQQQHNSRGKRNFCFFLHLYTPEIKLLNAIRRHSSVSFFRFRFCSNSTTAIAITGTMQCQWLNTNPIVLAPSVLNIPCDCVSIMTIEKKEQKIAQMENGTEIRFCRRAGLVWGLESGSCPWYYCSILYAALQRMAL